MTFVRKSPEVLVSLLTSYNSDESAQNVLKMEFLHMNVKLMEVKKVIPISETTNNGYDNYGSRARSPGLKGAATAYWPSYSFYSKLLFLQLNTSPLTIIKDVLSLGMLFFSSSCYL